MPAADIGRISVAVTVRNSGTRVGIRPLLLFAQRLPGQSGPDESDGAGGGVSLADQVTTCSRLCESQVDLHEDVQPAHEEVTTLTFGAEEMSRWVPPGGFVVVSGRYLMHNGCGRAG